MKDAVFEAGKLQQDVVADFILETERLEALKGAQKFQGIGGQLAFEPRPADFAVRQLAIFPFDPRAFFALRIDGYEGVVVFVDSHDGVGLAAFVAAAWKGDFDALFGLGTGHGFVFVFVSARSVGPADVLGLAWEVERDARCAAGWTKCGWRVSAGL